MDGIPLSLLWRNFCQEEMKTFSFAEEEVVPKADLGYTQDLSADLNEQTE